MTDDAIPVTVVGGYLGAGKTTLVNRILSGEHGRRVAVIVNDFGDVMIDEALLAPTDGGVWALANGCVCCAAVDGLASAIAEIRALSPPPEQLVIEVSGVGDPWAVAQWGRGPGFVLDAVVVLADPGEIRTWADDPHVGDGVRHQLAVADVVVLSRVDVTADGDRAEVESWLGRVTAAPVVPGADQLLSVLWHAGWPVQEREPAPHAHHGSRSVRPRPATRAETIAWLEAAPPGVVRVKGFVPAAEHGDRPWLAQRMGRRVEVVRHRGSGDAGIVAIFSGAGDPAVVEEWLATRRL